VSESRAFSYACEELERATSLDRLEARGTVRLALKQAGLEASSVSPLQMGVVLGELMPAELASRGIDDAVGVCAAIRGGIDALPEEAAADAPEAVFARLGGSA
jgi:hypothetical protein